MTDQPVEPRKRETDQHAAAAPGEPAVSSAADRDGEAAREALNGSDAGSDTRAGSLQGGSNSGSEHDEAQTASDRHLADIGRGLKAASGDKPPTP